MKWHPRDLLLLMILILAILSLLNLRHGGLTGLIATTDKPSAVYGDFSEYYYPAGRMIFSHPEPLGGYFYTPAFAIILHSVALDSYADAMIIWQIVQHLLTALLLIVPGVYLARRTGGKFYFHLYVLLVLTSFPLLHNLKWGQLSVMITFCTIFSLILKERERPWAAAILLTVATLVKYYPAAFMFYYLIRKDFAFIGRFALCMVIAGLLFPAAVIGLTTTVEFYRLLNSELAYALDWVVYDLNSQFLPHVIMRMTGMEPDAAGRGSLSLLGILICLPVFFRLYQGRNTGSQLNILSASGIFLLLPMLINTSWPHYFVYLPFCAILLWPCCSSCWQKSAVIIAMVLQSLLVFWFTDYRFYSGNGLLLLADLLLLIVWFTAQKTPPDSGLCDRNPEVSFN